MTNAELIAQAWGLADGPLPNQRAQNAWIATAEELLPALATALTTSIERTEQLIAALRIAYKLIEDEWVGTQGPFGEGGEWMAEARALIAEMANKS